MLTVFINRVKKNGENVGMAGDMTPAGAEGINIG